MITNITEAFSVTHVEIMNGSQTFEEAAASSSGTDIYGVRNASLEADVGDYDNVGDDSILASWRWFNKATLNVVAGYISFVTLAKITGETAGSSGSGSAVKFSFNLWSETQMNVSPCAVLLKCPAKDTTGTVRNLLIGLYKVQFGPLQITGPAYKEGLTVSYVGTVLQSLNDEKGTALSPATPTVGRLISVQSA
jgi:hypothetical protein